ncbi:LysM peptidoglycan-binding domain-containing protein [Brevibacillus nitrificans]|uniref:LysM peptidoglycan-binding domain-containing protein n=1 Tax=Brevibacillus nitrificans TaxID=651560 RepID=UPI002866D5F2|nr:LysM peptidoglycan-binding domain-containing protein [Brevibacillus nitrificans]MDR7314014.1 cytoskeletal protein RodZ [Brevibacillus nitrificans]
MSTEQTGLPPRRSRTKRPSGSISLKKLITSGLYLFGALFFGLIGVELYQAKMNHPSETEGSPIVSTVANSPTQTAAAGVETISPAPAPAEQAQTPKTNEATAALNQPALPDAEQSQEPVVSPSGQTGTKEVTGKVENVTKPQTDAKARTQAKPSAAAKPAAAVQKPKAIKHVVQKGETLYMLSRKYYGNNSHVARIANYNGLSLEAQLTAGKVVLVPLLP